MFDRSRLHHFRLPRCAALVRGVVLVAAAFVVVVPAFVLPARPAFAQQVYWMDGEPPRGLAGVNVRRLPEASLVIAGDDRSPLDLPGAARFTPPPGGDLFLVEMPDPPSDRVALNAICTVLRAVGRFALVAATPAQARSLDVLGNRKERLLHLEPMRSRDLSPAGKTAAVDPQVKADIVAAVNQDRFAVIDKELSGGLYFWLDGEQISNNNRYTHNPKHYIAADYLQARYEQLGYAVIRQEFPVYGTMTQNIIAVKTGTVYPDEIVVVGGHYDSISQNTAVAAPGAEDNGSGTSAVLHLAEIFSAYETERTIHFVAFGGEEEGLFGSQQYVQQAVLNGWNVIDALTMDMIATWVTNYAVIIEGEHYWEPLMSLFEANVISEAQIGYRKDYYSFGSDHVPFQQAGIPAFLAIDMDYGSYAHYHRTTDTWNHLDMSLGWKIMRAMAGAVADLTNPTPIGATAVPAAPRFVLEQNNPNPFNPSTEIRFQLPAAGPASLTIYDVAGRRVRTLLDGPAGAGPGRATWNGRDEAGKAVASGIYVYRLKTAAGTQTRRMVLAK